MTPNISQIIAKRQAALGISDEHLALRAGLLKGAAIRAIKKEQMRLPLNKVESMAEALQLDASTLFDKALAEQIPQLKESLDRLYVPLDSTEGRLIAHLRQVAGKGESWKPVVLDGKTVVAIVSC